MGCGVTLRIAAIIARPSGGVPSASNTTTASLVTTKPAFDMKPLVLALAVPASPWKNHPCGDTCCGVSASSGVLAARAGDVEVAMANASAHSRLAGRVECTRIGQ